MTQQEQDLQDLICSINAAIETYEAKHKQGAQVMIAAYAGMKDELGTSSVLFHGVTRMEVINFITYNLED